MPVHPNTPEPLRAALYNMELTVQSIKKSVAFAAPEQMDLFWGELQERLADTLVDLFLSDREALATIGFQPEAHDSAAQFFQQLKGWTITVVTYEGETFDAECGNVEFAEGGDILLECWPWNEDLGSGDRSKPPRMLDIYGAIARIEVL